MLIHSVECYDEECQVLCSVLLICITKLKIHKSKAKARK